MTSNIKIVKGPTKAKLSNKNDIKNIKKEFILEGLGCANCANKMEQQINELEGIHSANVNFITKTLILEIKETNKVEELIKSVTNIVTNIESHVKVKEKELKKVLKKEILLEGLCCANCAAKIERECNKIEDVKCAVVDFIKAKLIIEINNPSKQNDIIENVKKIVKKLNQMLML
ncbi:cation transport ATPase [Clostridium saccharobutylicum]|nr:cation transport ATPase [Clostridium saccharobutylicum]NOV85264.1 cation transport ATPase [Clostridium saccharobutylicum]NOW10680.1 cation transport ATPase [Clostridium saccharobutylicum]NOW60731.1 cation transport ATPase [Clostridium saccharobutylicum]